MESGGVEGESTHVMVPHDLNTSSAVHGQHEPQRQNLQNVALESQILSQTMQQILRHEFPKGGETVVADKSEAVSVVPSKAAPEAHTPERPIQAVRSITSPDWLPSGWRTIEKTRTGGKTAGSKDKYYIEEATNRQFRSKNEVTNYLAKKEASKNIPNGQVDNIVPSVSKGTPTVMKSEINGNSIAKATKSEKIIEIAVLPSNTVVTFESGKKETVRNLPKAISFMDMKIPTKSRTKRLRKDGESPVSQERESNIPGTRQLNPPEELPQVNRTVEPSVSPNPMLNLGDQKEGAAEPSRKFSMGSRIPGVAELEMLLEAARQLSEEGQKKKPKQEAIANTKIPAPLSKPPEAKTPGDLSTMPKPHPKLAMFKSRSTFALKKSIAQLDAQKKLVQAEVASLEKLVAGNPPTIHLLPPGNTSTPTPVPAETPEGVRPTQGSGNQQVSGGPPGGVAVSVQREKPPLFLPKAQHLQNGVPLYQELTRPSGSAPQPPPVLTQGKGAFQQFFSKENSKKEAPNPGFEQTTNQGTPQGFQAVPGQDLNPKPHPFFAPSWEVQGQGQKNVSVPIQLKDGGNPQGFVQSPRPILPRFSVFSPQKPVDVSGQFPHLQRSYPPTEVDISSEIDASVTAVGKKICQRAMVSLLGWLEESGCGNPNLPVSRIRESLPKGTPPFPIFRENL